MRIEDIRRWQWIVAGLIAGLVIAYARTGFEPSSNVRRVNPAQFVWAVTANDLPDKSPRVKNIVLHEPIAGVYGKTVQVVTFQGAVYDRSGKTCRYEASATELELPFRFGRGGDAAGTSLESYLQRVAREHPFISYTHAWWERPVWWYGLWTVGSVVVVGGLWPMMLGLLVGAGLGRRRREPEPEYDLSRFEHGSPEPPQATAASAAAITDRAAAELRELEAELERNLSASPAGADPSPASASAEAAPAKSPLRQLTGGPVEAVAEPPREQKQYDGEFYPTETHVKRH